MRQFTGTFVSPLGRLSLAVREDGALSMLEFDERRAGDFLRRAAGKGTRFERDESRCAVVREQLEEWFAGERRAFDLPLAPDGTAFQRRCWDELTRIPFGETRSYGELARAIGRPGSSRAVGQANHRNPISIVVPCHRVVGADGSLTGYGGGIDRKRSLLDFERGQLAFAPARQR